MSQRVDKLINDFIDLCLDPSNDAGWRGDSMIARFIEFKGVPPGASGNDKSNEAMINHIRGLKDAPKHQRIAKEFVFELYKSPKPYSRLAVLSLLAKNAIRGLIQTEEGDRPVTDEDRARAVGVGVAEYRKLLAVGYDYGQEMLSKNRFTKSEFFETIS